MHALVTNGTVTRTGDLPQVWRWPDGSWTSNFHLMPAADLARAGWLPVTEIQPPLADGQTYGPPTYQIANGRVTATYPVQDLPAPEPDPIETRLTALEAKVAESDALKAILVDKGVIAEADVIAIAAPAEQVAIKG